MNNFFNNNEEKQLFIDTFKTILPSNFILNEYFIEEICLAYNTISKECYLHNLSENKEDVLKTSLFLKNNLNPIFEKFKLDFEDFTLFDDTFMVFLRDILKIRAN